MNTEKTVEAIQLAAAQSHDPAFIGLAWVLGIVIMALAIAQPIMGMVRKYQSNKAEGAKDSADEALYNQLKDQIEMNSKDIRALIDEKNKWYEEALHLRTRITQLEQCEKLVQVMKDKLDKKDSEIQERDTENRRLMYEIIQLKDRLHHLELRLAEDEQKFCESCEFKKVR